MFYIINLTNYTGTITLHSSMRDNPRQSTNPKEEIMRVKNIMMMGFFSLVAATGVTNASSSFAADANRVGVMDERIGHGGSTYDSSQPDGASDCPVRPGEQREVDVIERIGTGGSTYAFSKTDGCQMAGEGRKKVDVIKRIGTGGSTYSTSQPIS